MNTAMEIIPGLPNAVSLLILARFPLSLHALLCRVSKAWRDALQPSSSVNALTMIRKTLHISQTWVLFGLCEEYDLSGFLIADPVVGCRHDAIISSSPWPYCSYRGLCRLPPIVVGSEVLIASDCRFSDNKRLHCFDAQAMRMQDNLALFLPGYICHYATVALDGFTYVAGGEKDGMASKSVYRLNHLAKAWELVPDMHKVRRRAAAVVLHGQLCVIGGYMQNGAAQFSGEILDPYSGTWMLIPELWPAHFFKAAKIKVAVVKNKLYALRNNGHHIDVHEIMHYDDATKSWSSLGLLAVKSICDDIKGSFCCQALGIGDQLAVIVYNNNECTSISILTTTPTLTKPLTWKCFSLVINGNVFRTAFAVHV